MIKMFLCLVRLRQTHSVAMNANENLQSGGATTEKVTNEVCRQMLQHRSARVEEM